MNNSPKVSIITVVYNGVAHLEQTIQSVVNQTYDNVEYIVIDGDSTDGTVELLEKYDSNIDYWVSEPDNGIYNAMNKGIDKASGDIVGLINADDWYEVNAVENVVATFQNSYADVVHGSMYILKEDGSGFVKGVQLDLTNLSKGMLLNHPTVFSKRSLYDAYGDFNTAYKIVADWELMVRWRLKGMNFVGIDNTLANFRMGGVSSAHLKKSFSEKHMVRHELGLVNTLDWYYVYDKVKSLFPGKLLLNISLLRQKCLGS